jgi:hypothetical protein
VNVDDRQLNDRQIQQLLGFDGHLVYSLFFYGHLQSCIAVNRMTVKIFWRPLSLEYIFWRSVTKLYCYELNDRQNILTAIYFTVYFLTVIYKVVWLWTEWPSKYLGFDGHLVYSIFFDGHLQICIAVNRMNVKIFWRPFILQYIFWRSFTKLYCCEPNDRQNIWVLTAT